MGLGKAEDAEELEDLVMSKLLETSVKNSTQCCGHKRRMACAFRGGDAELDAGRTAGG